ncbi:MAG TPA: hypothetical protein VHO47_01515 [Candidatus Babeliales bacterium]|nr:hypothetical protein [Candidatus Babeliales bacterium]
MDFKKILLAALFFAPTFHSHAYYIQVDPRTASEKIKEAFATYASSAKETIRPILNTVGDKAKEKITQLAYSDPRLVGMSAIGAAGGIFGTYLLCSGINTATSEKPQDRNKSGLGKILSGFALIASSALWIAKSKDILNACR